MQDTIEIIANKLSGKGNGAKCLAAAQNYLNERGIPHRVHVTKAVGHGRALAQSLCAEGARTIAALGGDGTLHEVLNGMDFAAARMGFIPAGRGNDFVKGTGAASLDPVRAIADIVCGRPRDIDYLQIGDKRCLNVAGTGLDVEVLLKTAQSKNKLSYVASLFRCLLHYKPYRVLVTANGDTQIYDCIMAGVCNGTQIGGGIRLCPPALADDGKLNVLVMEKPKRVPTVLVMPKFVKGKHMSKPYTHHIVCDRVRIETPAPVQLDGEIYRNLAFEAHIVPRGLKTFAANASV
ncbi:MAG: YegS/Rv2252/BmrU family lipid kinase [Clostridia bacterium]|jgi:diacylglycerol kinase (ATP)|nr:YegS/Rv2252/BmrU family lipid kinase [Clostridia bacterium]